MTDYGKGYETPAHAERARNYCRIRAVEATRGWWERGEGARGWPSKEESLGVLCGRALRETDRLVRVGDRLPGRQRPEYQVAF